MQLAIQDAILLIGLVGAFVSLQGCNFSSAAETCAGDSCNCYINFYAMDANISIGTTQIEHASRRIMLTGIANDVHNASTSDCCFSIQSLFQSQIRGVAPQAGQLQDFCGKCAKSLNKEVAKAASNCSASPRVDGSARRLASQFLAAILQSPKEAKLGLTKGQLVGTPPVSDDYDDCDVNFEGKDANLTLNGVTLDNAQSDFRIKWTDRHTSQAKSCCESLKPLVTSVYVKGTMPEKAVQQKFCTACKEAYNTGVAAAAYRSCTANETLVV